MRHEKSLGRYCRWISRREHAPDAPRPTTGALLVHHRLHLASRAFALARRPTAARGDIIIRYERVYEAANHSHVHISNGPLSSLFSLMAVVFEFPIPPALPPLPQPDAAAPPVLSPLGIFCHPSQPHIT